MKLPSKRQMILTEEEAHLKLGFLGQEHLLNYWQQLNLKERESLIEQITHLDSDFFRRQQEEILKKHFALKDSIEQVEIYSTEGNQEDFDLGMRLASAGKTVLLVLAGGQGSRLRCTGPKGCCEITNIYHKSLFQLLAEKIRAASILLQRPLQVAIMTSPLNFVETQEFFAAHAFFGLDPNQIYFFYQKMWPLVDFQGNLFLEDKNQIACGPNGNGSVFHRLLEGQMYEKWENMGIEMINVIPIDNPLAPVFDFELFGLHARLGNEISLRVAPRLFSEEKVGVLARKNGKISVIEYLELELISHTFAPKSEKSELAKSIDDQLKYGLANLGIYCFSLSFIKKVAAQTLPLHKAKKTAKMLDQNGQTLFPETPNAWKFEEFIFDVLPFAERVHPFLSKRESCFAPLKNLKGEDSIDTVRAALLAFEAKLFAKITGNWPPLGTLFELDPQFYYPTPDLLKKWKKKPFPNKGYIDE